VAIIDQFGLNDYIVARHPMIPGKFRRMAHDRYAPRPYSYSFAINYGRLANNSYGFTQRDFELTAEEIIANERFWIDRIVGGDSASHPYLMVCRIGETYNRLRFLDTASTWLHQAVAMDTTQPRGYVGLATTMFGIGQYDSALVLLRRADQLDPDNPLIQTRLGQNHAGRGYDLLKDDRDEALTAFKTAEHHLVGALSLDSNATDALIELAALNLFLDRYDSSAVFLKRLESSYQPSPLSLDLLGQRYEFKGRSDLAARAYALAIKNGLNVGVARVRKQRFPGLEVP
jgi:predicted Zn-dependent protease